MNSSQRIPTHIITGFLGSGKTTTINALLQALRDEGEDVLVVMNEMGSVGIDAALLQQPQRGILELTGGCMCCALRVAMETQLAAILRRWRPTRILIEPTGVGHPRDLLRVIEGPHLRAILDSGPHLVVVDPRLHGDAQIRQHPLYRDQWSVAQRVAIAKTDLAPAVDYAAIIIDATGDGRPWGKGGMDASLALLSPLPSQQPLAPQPAPIPASEEGVWHGYRAVHLSPRQQVPSLAQVRALCQRLANGPMPVRAKGLICEGEVAWELQLTAWGLQESAHPSSRAKGVPAGMTVIVPSHHPLEDLLALAGPDWHSGPQESAPETRPGNVG
ncbi:MAG: hypothetical protein EA402_09865 [Planctomycetota bacterium]|nr:MAG: hypothetical protein EA402_09865 [Planctomycetota bacterium]